FREEFLRLQNFSSLEVPDLGRKPLDRTRNHRQDCEIHRVPVARDDLRRNRLNREAELSRHMLLDARIDIGKGADRSRDCASGDLLLRGNKPLPGAREFGESKGKLEPEGYRLGVDAVAPANGGGVFVRDSAPVKIGEELSEVGEEDI